MPTRPASRRRRWWRPRPWRRAPLLTAALLAVVALAVPVAAVARAGATTAAAQAAVRPLIWHGTAGAAGVVVDVNTDPRVLPLDQFVHGELPQASTDWSSNGAATAQASSFFPGTSGTQGPALICDFGLPCDQIPGFPPTYPLTVEANPGNPQASTQSGYASAEVDGTLVFARASADNAQGMREAFAALSAAFTTSKAEARSLQEFVDGWLVVTADARVEELDVGGGALSVDSIQASSVSRADGSTAEGSSTITIQGAEAGGTPVTIGSNGVEVAGQGVGGAEKDEINRQLNEQLAEQGIRVRTIGGDHTDEGGRSRGHAAGLLVELAIDLPAPPGSGDLPPVPDIPGLPIPVPNPNIAFRTYLFTMVIGNAATTAFATDEGFSLGGLGGDLGGGLVSSPPSDGGTSGGASGAGPTGTGTAPDIGPPATTAPPPAGGAASPPQVAPGAGDGGAPFEFGLLGGAVTGRITGAYVVMGAVALLLALLSQVAPWRALRAEAASGTASDTTSGTTSDTTGETDDR